MYLENFTELGNGQGVSTNMVTTRTKQRFAEKHRWREPGCQRRASISQDTRQLRWKRFHRNPASGLWNIPKTRGTQQAPAEISLPLNSSVMIGV